MYKLKFFSGIVKTFFLVYSNLEIICFEPFYLSAKTKLKVDLHVERITREKRETLFDGMRRHGMIGAPSRKIFKVIPITYKAETK